MNVAESLATGGRRVGAASGVVIPALSFFSSYPPPLFPAVSLITSALSGAILLAARAWRPKSDPVSQRMPRVVTLGGTFVVLSIPFLIAYVLALQFTTVRVPASGDRLQIGFGRSNWTLTEAGKTWTRQFPQITAEQLLRNEGFAQDRAQIIWETWSIYSAGALLIVLYFLAFGIWTTGFALLAKHRSLVQGDSDGGA